MFEIGVPLFLLATPAIFLFERGSLPRWMIGKVALLGWVLVLLAVVLHLAIRILQDAFANLPGA